MTQLLKLGFDQKDKDNTKRKVQTLAAGAFAGAVSSVAVAPIDSIKDTQKLHINNNRIAEETAKRVAAETSTAFEAPHMQSTGFGEVAKDLWQSTKGKGLKAKYQTFYPGNMGSVLKIAPATAISFLVYDTLKDKINEKD